MSSRASPQLPAGLSDVDQTITGTPRAARAPNAPPPLDEMRGSEDVLRAPEGVSRQSFYAFSDNVEPRESHSATHPRSDLASRGSLDDDRRSPGPGGPHFNLEPARGRSRHARRNPSPAYRLRSPHQPERVLRSRPLSGPAPDTDVQTQPDRPRGRFSAPSLSPPRIIPRATRPSSRPPQGPTLIRQPDPYAQRTRAPSPILRGGPSRRASSSRHRPRPHSQHYFNDPYGVHSDPAYGANPYSSYPYSTVPPPPVIIIPPQVTSPESAPAQPSPPGSSNSNPGRGRRASRSHYPFTPPPPSLPSPVSSHRHTRRPSWHNRLTRLLLSTVLFIFVQIPRQIYLLLLLRLPSLYFSRVTRLFEDANLSLPDIRRMAVANADQWKDGTPGALITTWIPDDAAVSPSLLNFRHSWEGFIDSLLREWKTQNIVSALMLSAILTMLQIDAAAADPIARTTALLSLISALMSLLFGSMYIIRFGTMRKMYKAASWAEEAQKGRTSILWNVWILLAIPAVWLAWSIILFVTCIMAFTWRTGAADDPVDTALSHTTARGLRIGVSAVLAVAVVYLFLIVRTFRKYGDVMDRKWNEKVVNWAREGRYAQIGAYDGAWRSSLEGRDGGSRNRWYSRRPSTPPYSRYPAAAHSWRGYDAPSSFVAERTRDVSPLVPTFDGPFAPPPVPTAAPFDRPFVQTALLTPFTAIKIMDLRSRFSRVCPFPALDLQERDILLADWRRFTGELEDVWDGGSTDAPPFPIDPGGVFGTRERAAGIIHLWNCKFFRVRSTEAVLCLEQPPGYAVYLLNRSPDAPDTSTLFGPLPDELQGISIIHLVERPDGEQMSVQYKIGPGRAAHGNGGSDSPAAGAVLGQSEPLPPSPPLSSRARLSTRPTRVSTPPYLRGASLLISQSRSDLPAA
ncbi:hypothetical protein B0H17DRAFT_1143835 [Mycena rosella]|uniref:Uncharacterized protein n=1 Tax=Mycena rosella TaxID=1033263 RepID=A0AAD7CU81_MYCRO|nr:hypothetical protein B0H17DRAFT_1143835 [Mycena rosella]